MVNVALRGLVPVFALTVNETVPLPLPLVAEVMMIQDGTFVTDQLQPAAAVTLMLPVPPFAAKLWLVGLIETLQLVPAVIVKLAFEISKKMLPTASTLTRACVVGVFGTVTASEPSLGVVASTRGKV